MVRNMRENAMDKGRRLAKNGNLFLISETPKHEYWLVKGKEKRTYDILFHKIKNLYTCTCKNLRLTPCSHILAIRFKKGEITLGDNGETNNTYKRNGLESVIQV